MDERLPSGWARAPLSELLTTIQTGKSFKCDERPPAVNEVGVVKVSAVSWGEYREQESKTCMDPAQVHEERFVRAGDFLFSRANTIELVGACVIARRVTQPVMLSDKILRFQFAVEDMKPWVLHFLRSVEGRAQIEMLASGNQDSMRNIGQSRIGQLQVPVPPCSERTRIVAELEELLSELDAGVAELRVAQKKLIQYRQSLLKSAVEGALTADCRHGNTLDETRGGLPAGWESVTVGQLGTVQLGRQRSPDKLLSANPTKYIRAANITEAGVDLSDVLSMDFSEAEMQTFTLRAGDVLLTEASGSAEHVGRPALWPGGDGVHCFQNTVLRFRPTRTSSEFAFYLFMAQQKLGVFAKLSGGVGINHLSAGKFGALLVPLPPPAEQSEIVRRLHHTFALIAEQQKAIARALAMAAAQRQNILRAAFAGQLVAQDPADEPASALLARIRAERGAAAANKPTAGRGRKAKIAA